MWVLREWSEWNPTPEYAAWILSDMAKYAALRGESEAGFALLEQAIAAAKQCTNSIELQLRYLDYGRLLLETGNPAQALRVLPNPDTTLFYPLQVVETMQLIAEAHRKLGSQSEAHDWQARAFCTIEAHGLDRLRPHAETLAKTF